MQLPSSLKGAAIPLIAGNLGALYFFLAWDFTALQLATLFVMECLWIGVFGALKLLGASLAGNPYDTENVGVSPGLSFFASMFLIWLLGGKFLVMIGAMIGGLVYVASEMGAMRPPDIVEHLGTAIFYPSMMLILGHLVSFVWDFLIRGEYKTARPEQLIGAPFVRCLALIAAFAVAIGGVLLMPSLMNASMFGVLVVGIKIALDVHMHASERNRFRPRVHREPPPIPRGVVPTRVEPPPIPVQRASIREPLNERVS